MTQVNILAGPPLCTDHDMEVVEKFYSLDGFHIVCGGSSAIMTARCLGLELSLPLDGCIDNDMLPPGMIGDNIFATEGIITLANVCQAFKTGTAPPKGTGEYLLYSKLTSCNEVNIFWGCAVNSCHPNEIAYSKKEEILIYLINKLRDLNKKVTIYKN